MYVVIDSYLGGLFLAEIDLLPNSSRMLGQNLAGLDSIKFIFFDQNLFQIWKVPLNSF